MISNLLGRFDGRGLCIATPKYLQHRGTPRHLHEQVTQMVFWSGRG